MSLSKFHRSLASGYFLLIISLLYFLGIRLWVIGYPGNPDLWITAGIQVLTAILISFLNHDFRIIREKSFLPFVFYFLFVSIDPSFFLAWKESLYVLSLLLCFYFLFQSYEEVFPRKQALKIGILLSVGMLFHPSFYPLVFLFLFGLYRFKSLNLKTFLAAFCGSLSVYIFLFCWCLYRNEPALFLDYFPDWTVFLPEPIEFHLKDLFVFIFSLILLILSGINIYLAGISEKIKNRVILSFLFLFSLFLFILIPIEFQWVIEWQGFLNLSLTLLLSHYFMKRINRAKTILLIFSILFFMGAGIWDLKIIHL
jgi:hypothetical protein